MQRVKLSLVCLSWFCLTGAIFAQSAANPVSTVDPSSPTGVSMVPSTSGTGVVTGGGIFDGTYLDIRHVVGDGVGYTNSYSQIGAFTPVWLTEDMLVAPNARVIITNSTQTGVNLGGVGRTYLNGWDRLLGVYGYYDNDQDTFNFRYQQFTIGAETLGRWWDLRVNGYIVNGNQNNLIGPSGIGNTPTYAGNNIVFQGQQLRDQALSGVDFELGGPLSPWTPWLRGYGGMYDYYHQGGNTVGGRARLEANVANDLMLGMYVSQDALYGTNINGIIEFKFSGFRPTVWFPKMTTRQRMLNTVQRNWRIATHTFEQNVNVVATNPANNTPYFITFVKNDAAPGGNGTFEHPFTSLPASAPGNIIFVEHGSSAPTTGNITLANNQILLGAGFPYPIALQASFGSFSTSGIYTLPGTSSSFPYPVLTGGGAGSIVTLANNNEVTGLTFSNPFGSGITNSPYPGNPGTPYPNNPNPGSSNFYIHDVNITGNNGFGINLVNASSNPNSNNQISLINGNHVSGAIINNVNVGTAASPNPQGLGGNVLGGIQIATGAPGLTLQMNNVNMNGAPGSPEAFGISLIANNAPLTVSMNNIQTNGNLGEGIGFSGTGQAISVAANNIAANGNGGDGLDVGTQAAPIQNANVNFTLTGVSTFNGNTGSGVVLSQSGAGGTGAYSLTGISATGNGQNGLAIFGANSTTMTTTVTNGTLNSNGLDGIHVEGLSGAKLGLTVDPTSISSNARDGLYYLLNGTGTLLAANFTNDTMNNNGSAAFPTGDAVFGQMTNAAAANLTFSNVSGQGSAGDGFLLNIASNSLAIINLNSGTSFSNSGQRTAGSSGIEIQSDDAAVNLTATSITANNIAPNTTEAFGLKLGILDGSLFSGSIASSDFSRNTTNAVNFNVQTGVNGGSAIGAFNGTTGLVLSGVTGNSSGADGINGTVAGIGSAALVTIQSANSGAASTFNNSGANGMNLAALNSGNLQVVTSNAQFNNSATNGLNFSATNANPLNPTTMLSVNDTGGSSFSNSGLGGVNGSGVLGTVSGNSLASLTFGGTAAGTTINNNLDNGVFVTATNGGIIQAAFNGGTVNGNGLGTLVGGVPTLTDRHNDGILLELDRSGTALNPSSLTMNLTGGLTTSVNGNGNDGLEIRANDASILVGSITNALFENNGVATDPGTLTDVANKAGIEINTNAVEINGVAPVAANTTVNLAFNNVTSGNTGTTLSQQTGFLSQTDVKGQMNAAFTGGSLSNNANNAVNSTVIGTGTFTDATLAMVSLNGVTANNSGGAGVFLAAEDAGVLNFAATNGSSISKSGADGILAIAEGIDSATNISQINLLLTSLQLNNNGVTFGGMGLDAQVSAGAQLNAQISSSTINLNGNQGIGLLVDGTGAPINATTANFEVLNTTVNGNLNQGLTINALNGADVNYRSETSAGSTTSTSYNNNGGAGTFDGVTLVANNNSTLLTLFDGNVISGNTGNGISLTDTNGSTMTTSLTSDTITNNAGFGIFIGDLTGSSGFNLIMTGNNTVTGNGSGSFNTTGFNFVGLNQVFLALQGSSTTGFSASFTNVTNAGFELSGNGTDDGNTGNGVTVTMNNVTNGSVFINGYGDISNNTGDGINVTFTDVANGEIGVVGPTTMNNNGHDAINISLTDSNLVDGLSFGAGSTVLVLEPSTVPGANQPPPTFDPALNKLPQPVSISLGTVTPGFGLVVDGVLSNTSGVSGLNVVATTATGTSSIQSLLIENNTFAVPTTATGKGTGDGIDLSLTNTPVAVPSATSPNPSLSIIGNQIGGWQGNGIDLDLSGPTTPSTVATLNISGNSIGTIGTATDGLAAGALANVKDGILLTATDNSTIGSVGTNTNFFSNTISNNGQNGIEFLLTNTDLFNPTFSGNVISNNGGDGIRMVTPTMQTITDIDATFLGNTITSNRGDGVNIQLQNGAQNLLAVFGSTTVANSGNNISSNSGGPGVNIQMGTGSIDAGSEFVGNTISSNGTLAGSGNGQGIEFNMGGANINALFQNNVINSNASQGINFAMSTGGILTMTGDFSNNTIDNNGLINATNINNFATFAGVNFNMGVTGAIVADNIDNNQINGNGAEGMNIALQTNGLFTGTGGAASNFFGNTVSNNGSVGVRLTSPDGSTFNWNLGEVGQAANVISGNNNAGVGITLGITATGTGTLNVVNTTFSGTKAVGTDAQGFNGEGLAVVLQGSSVLSGGITTSQFTNNASDGAFVDVVGVSLTTFSQLNTFSVSNSQFTGNQNNGLEFMRGGYGMIGSNPLTPIEISGDTFSKNGFNLTTGLNINAAALGTGQAGHTPSAIWNTITGNGLDISATGATNVVTIDNYDISGNTITGNGGNGILFNVIGQADINANMNLSGTTTNMIALNNYSGIQLVEHVGDTQADNRALTGTWLGDMVTQNKGNGISLDGETSLGPAAAPTSQLNIGQTIAPVATTYWNMITNNGLNGIEVGGRGSVTIAYNYVNGNGNAATLGTTNGTIDLQNAGLMLDVGPVLNSRTGSVDQLDSVVTVQNNTISNNNGDGIMYGIANTIAGLPDQDNAFFYLLQAQVEINNNQIVNNLGRGINLINRGTYLTQADISTNVVSGNQLEGIYVVNTSDTSQAQASYNNQQLTALYQAGQVPLTANGNPGGLVQAADADLQIRIVNNSVTGNGSNSGLGGTGIVMAIGTTDGGYQPTDPGGFASTGTALAAYNPGAPQSFAAFLGSFTQVNGGVIAQIDSNSVLGNLGNDIAFQSFTSTVSPTATSVTFTSPDPNPTSFPSPGYSGDPLSRFDLYFRNNTVDINTVTGVPLIDSLGQSFVNKVNNANGYNNGYNPISQSLLAYYNNADSYKSNQAANPPTFDSGPFGQSTNRARNATREAAFLTPYNLPAGATQIIYSGLGPSTWRISSDSTAILGLTNNGQTIIDSNPLTNDFPFFPGGPNGILQTIADQDNGQMPFGWGTF